METGKGEWKREEGCYTVSVGKKEGGKGENKYVHLKLQFYYFCKYIS